MQVAETDAREPRVYCRECWWCAQEEIKLRAKDYNKYMQRYREKTEIDEQDRQEFYEKKDLEKLRNM